MSELTKLNLRDLEAGKSPTVFAVNNTKGKFRGQVVIAVPRSNGVGMDSVIIPSTFVPVELTEQVSKRQLLDSADFRRAVAKGLITLVSADDAIRYLETNDAKEEMQRLVNSQELQKTFMTATNVDDIEIPEELERPAQNLNGTELDEDGKMNGVELAVVQTVEMLKETGDERGTIATLKSQGELTELDYKYIMENCSKTEHAKVYDWARSAYNTVKQ